MPGSRSRADYGRLTAWLAQRGEQSVTVSWDELNTIVGGLPPSATDHYPQWWHGDRTNTRAWRAAGFELARVDLGRSVTFRRTTSPTSQAPPQRPIASGDATGPRPTVADVRELSAIDPRRAVLVIPCSSAKARRGQRDRRTAAAAWPDALSFARFRLRADAHVDERRVMPAWRRYTGQFYQHAGKSLAAAVAAGVPVIILSGGYGLLRADEQIGSYNKVLKLSDWPPGLLERLLAEEAARVGATAVVAFTPATNDYAKLVRRAPWRQRGIIPVLHVTVTLEGGGAMVKVPQRLGQTFAALWERDPNRYPTGLNVERLA